MSSGQKRMVINTRERAVSGDFNRSRDFSAAQVADALHALLDARSGVLTLGNGATELAGPAGPIATPIEGVILDGLMVVAPLGGTELSVTPGTALLVDIDGLPGSPVATAHSDDDSVAKLVHDPVGVLAGTGTLVLTPNVSGSTRVDVVEVRRLPNVVLETDNRDVFDPNTGLFTATSATKVMTARFEYRIRLGTPGAGTPASEQGWMPICVVSVPNAAASLDACILYDVRPLARDRANAGLTASLSRLPDRDADLVTDARTAPGERRLIGVVRGQHLGYRAGGELRWNYAGADQPWIDLQDPQFLEPGFGSAANQLIYLWLAFPAGLPRWVRYSAGAVAPFGGRVPSGHRGVPVISTRAPALQDAQTTASPMGLPPGSGLTGTTVQNGFLALALAADNGNDRCVVAVRDRRVHFVNDPSTAGVEPLITLSPTATTGQEDHYLLLFGTHIPRSAMRVLVQALAGLSGAAGSELFYTPRIAAVDPLDAIWEQEIREPHAAPVFGTMPAAGFVSVIVTAWVDLPALVPAPGSYSGVLGQRIRVLWNQNATKGGPSLRVLGWEM